MATPYDTGLDRNAANFQPLTPLSFLAARPQTSIRTRPQSFTATARGPIGSSTHARGGWRRRWRGAASSAATRSRWCCPTCRRCWKRITAWPWPARVLNSINTRLDAAIIAFILDHGEAKVLIIDREFAKVTKDALALCKAKPLVIDYDDPEFKGPGERLGGPRIRGVPARGRCRFRLADAAGRMGRHLAQLHLGHHRRSEGRGLSSPRRLSAGAWRTSSPAAWASIRSICGRCRCSTATAGAFRGRCRWSRARMSACARCARRRSSTPSPLTRSRICAARRS